jgi:hypothetical protein
MGASTKHFDRHVPRRDFLRRAACVLAGTLAAGPLAALCAPGHADTASRCALAFIGKYSDRICTRGERAGVTRLAAVIRDIPSFSEALFRARSAGISEMRAERTVLTFRAGGRVFEVENLAEADFARQGA